MKNFYPAVWKEIAKAQLKKQIKAAEAAKKKLAKEQEKAKKEQADADAREKNLEEAKKIVLTQPETPFTEAKIRGLTELLLSFEKIKIVPFSSIQHIYTTLHEVNA